MLGELSEGLGGLGGWQLTVFVLGLGVFLGVEHQLRHCCGVWTLSTIGLRRWLDVVDGDQWIVGIRLTL